MNLLADLNPAQREAVQHVDGPLLVLAGPGSGKTRVLTRRVAYLLRQEIKPWQILAITFTNKAAAEMRKRIVQMVPHRRVWISTFHSFGARILRQYADRIGLDRNFTIYDMKDRSALLKQALARANVDGVHFTPDRVGHAISRAKNQLQSPVEYARTANDFFAQTVLRVYPIYEDMLRANNAVDFDDLLYILARMLRRHEEIRAELDQRFQYILVDEYQDTNYAQYQIARLLSHDYPNLCVVGDPDQSIYKFRGSDIRNILDFEKDFPTARVITLKENYRSTRSILHAADGLIRHNRRRKVKELEATRGEGPPVRVCQFSSSHEEALGIAAQIRAAVDQGRRRYRDFAIVMRLNALSRGLENAMMRYRVPYQIVRGLAFFDRKENKDILAYLRLLVNPRDDVSFVRVVNEPPRSVGRVSIEHLRTYARERGLSMLEAAGQVSQIPTIRGKAARGLQEFVQLIRDLASIRDSDADQVIRQVIDRSGYRAALLKGKDQESVERLANIEELITAAREIKEEHGEGSVDAFLEHVTLVSDVDAWKEDQDRVSIMTLHAVKGLEFPVVYVMAMEQGILPHELSQQEADGIEEERRLAFVGMTRAMEELYLTHATVREFRGQAMYTVPSCFLDELPDTGVERQQSQSEPTPWPGGFSDDAVQTASPRSRRPSRATPARTEEAASSAVGGYHPGAKVKHRTYGVGTVTRVTGVGRSARVRIRFARLGERTFILTKAPLELVSE